MGRSGVFRERCVGAHPCIPVFPHVIYNQMVVSELSDTEVDRIFQALADATRRDIIAQAMTLEQSVSMLATRYAMSFAAVQKHVAVLERAALVTKERRGREQIVRGNPSPCVARRCCWTPTKRSGAVAQPASPTSSPSRCRYRHPHPHRHPKSHARSRVRTRKEQNYDSHQFRKGC